MRLDDGFANRQAQTGIAARCAICRRDKIARTRAANLRRQSPARIRHRQHGQAVLRRQLHAHFAVGLVILNRVGQQIRDDLRQPFGIAGDFQRLQFDDYFYAAFLRQRLHHFHAIGNGF